jgi:hypothetical protein
MPYTAANIRVHTIDFPERKIPLREHKNTYFDPPNTRRKIILFFSEKYFFFCRKNM